VRSEHPELKIIAAMARADVALVRMLVRQGISDVAELPFVPDELAAQILNVSSENPEVATSAALAPVYCVVRSVGGCGTTSVLTHLASALAASDDSRHGVCLVDFDIQGGEVANQIALVTPVSLGTLLEAGDRLDDDLVAGAVQPSRYGFSVLAAPDAIMPLEAVSLAQANAILTALRRSFSMVLVDLPADWSNWSLSIASEAHALLMVADGSIASLRQARRRIDLLESVGIEREKILVVANRLERRLFRTIGAQEISQALRSNVVATLADEGALLRTAQDQGVLLSETAGRSGFVRTINALAAQIRAGEI
jgi:pilus assembly protein CpaE